MVEYLVLECVDIRDAQIILNEKAKLGWRVVTQNYNEFSNRHAAHYSFVLERNVE